jgi:hypothetical protein
VRGLKPVLSFQTAYGTSKLVPLRTSTSHRTFSAGCKLVPLRTSTSHRTFSAGCKLVPLRTSTSHRTFSAGCKVVPLRTSTSHRTFSAGCKVVPFQNPTSTTGCSRGRVSTSAAWWRAHEVRAYRSPIGRNDDWYALLRAIPEYSAVFAVSPLQVKSRPSGC